jgi:thymidine phosphorylase
MLASTLLVKKREGHDLTDQEIRFLVNGYCSGEVTDYQMSAFAMAVCLRGMEPREIATLTHAMLESGDRLPRDPSSDRPRVDKHSTGGLGDKVSLILAPLLAACDVQVPMISGRGLGITGGTLDKLESIEGFRTDLSSSESSRVLNDAGAFIISASETIAPADRKLYALRDVNPSP